MNDHIDIPYPISITHISYRYLYRYPIDVRYPIFDIPHRYPTSISRSDLVTLSDSTSAFVVRPSCKAMVKAGIARIGEPAEGFVPGCLELPFIVGSAHFVDRSSSSRGGRQCAASYDHGARHELLLYSVCLFVYFPTRCRSCAIASD